MLAKKIYSKDKKLLAYVYFCTKYNLQEQDQDAFRKKLTADIQKTTTGYAGFATKKDLRSCLWLFDDNTTFPLPTFSAKRNYLQAIKKALQKTNLLLPLSPLSIYIFPDFTDFTKEKMNGVYGFCPWKKTIHLYCSPNAFDDIALQRTVCHEYNHAVYRDKHSWNTLLDSFIFEGLAEHFVDDVIGGERSLWTKAVSKHKAKEYFAQLKEDLQKTTLYFDVFFGGKKYPLWLGYTIGYYLIQDFLKKNKNLSWQEIMGLTPKQIFVCIDI